ncbi:hypothetical protein F4X88_05200 [Candidatus Poribacteria bacterium]|nr:hypothetical protein [Candidatus Poribacteria bacterium]MYA55670.1 hypothetical protein [Candidatus Poribacteria bacterium]
MTADLAIAQLLLSTLFVGVTLIWGILRYRRSGSWRRGVHNKLQAYLLWTLSVLIAMSCFFPLAHLYTEHLWFEHVGYAAVFWGLQKVRWGIFGVCFIVAAGFMNANTAIANMLCPESREFRRWTHTQTFSFHRMVICITLIAAFLLAGPMLLLDDIMLRYLNQSDVVAVESSLHFGMDRNFYLFSFPLHRWVSLWVEITLWVTCIVVGLLYNFYYRRDAHTMARVKRHIIFHGSALWILLLIVNGWRSYVNLWDKVYTKPLTNGLQTLHGLFYMDFHLAGATKIYCGVLIGIAIVIVINIFWRKRLLWYVSGAIWGLSYVLLIQAYPLGLHVARMRVEPFLKEGRYLQRHIEETRRAFDLDEIVRVDREPGTATLEMITENAEVKKNIQIWDRRVLYEALRETQIKPHYNFHPYTDVDRYTVDGEYRQVLIAAREIDPGPEITGWDRLKTDLRSFTHGYGVCVAPVNEFVGEGLPKLWVKDTPIDSAYKELTVEYPQIYYGEMIRNYMIVNTDRDANSAERRLDPESDEGVTETPEIPEWMQHTYAGDGGVSLGGWFRRLCFALRFDFIPILISEKLTPESRIMFRRRIGTRRNDRLVKDRVSYIAPFLNYDPDPYIVINDKQLYWIIDFYVTSRYYPNAQMYVDDKTQLTDSELYEEPDFDTFNYIRNAGVAVVNAYTGAVDFYAIKKDEVDETVMRTYQKAFPNLFKSLSEMPDGLEAHLRYPDYLTRIQARLYGDYYRQASGFYDNTNPWSIPKEAYYSSQADQEMMPYYAMLKLPGEEKVEFVNVIPFAPQDREKQLKAWMVARCDQPHYGERIVYVLPENAGIAGPTQVEDDINKKTGDQQRGWQTANDVIRGNLLIIPIENALFYLEAIYLQAKKPEGEDDDKPRRPKLEMVVLKAGSNELEAVQAQTFDEALNMLLLGIPANGETLTKGEKPSTLAELVQQYREREADSNQLLEQILEKMVE